MNNTIEHANIFYIRDFSELGGVETFVWEMVKKYKDLDIAVVYKNANQKQVKRVRQYCRAYQHINQLIKCKVAIINYDISIIDFIDKDAEIYQVIHGDYENEAYTWKPPTHERIKEYIGITKHICESFKRITGNKNVMLSYNPLTIQKQEKKLILISATRLSKIKGKDRMIKLANALDNSGIKYIWYVFTNDKKEIQSENVIFMKPRLDVSYWLEQADYLVQLSDTEACSYAINEALYRNIPIIVTPLPYLKEIGIEDKINSYIMEFDCSNINDIVKNINNKPSFQFKKLEDSYNNILNKTKSYYEEEKNMKARVKALKKFEEIIDAERGIKPKEGEEWITSRDRAEFLESKQVVKILEFIKEEPKNKSITKTTTRKTTSGTRTKKIIAKKN